jgi:hypothetical protein
MAAPAPSGRGFGIIFADAIVSFRGCLGVMVESLKVIGKVIGNVIGGFASDIGAPAPIV